MVHEISQIICMETSLQQGQGMLQFTQAICICVCTSVFKEVCMLRLLEAPGFNRPRNKVRGRSEVSEREGQLEEKF